ncbi:alginate lyase family protein [Adhaeribacter swui]|uniref:Alginate lyase family protein n=1 Tax=Adhaeribacter swui TaxID=2086471 RepID=A0A7G7GDI5_9BACT|nr:alginate lyase family protein [Adhaeribacter swui]QNF35219.1 alginate lyase family protein [Adhaeribacter swui]
MEKSAFNPLNVAAHQSTAATATAAHSENEGLDWETEELDADYLQTEFETDPSLQTKPDDPRIPPLSETDTNITVGTFANRQPPISWSFPSLQTNATLYKQVLSGDSDRIFLKNAVNRLESIIANNNLLDKAPYGIAPKLKTYSYTDTNGATITKPMIATSSPNDYVSLATYWWPDPNAANGLPYLVHDGKVNPENNAIPDHKLLRAICADIQLLGLAYYFTKKDAYASKAIALLRAFFLDPATRMNPHLKYAQIIMGVNEGYGRSIGFVDAELLPELLNGYQLLQESPALVDAPEVDAGMKAWFREFWKWLTTQYSAVPKKGTEAFYHCQMMKEIKAAKNNIRSAFELQVISYALFLGEEAWAINEINQVLKDTETSKGLISEQILPESGNFITKDSSGTEQTFPVPAGAMPKEIKRAKPATYCQKNLDLLLRLCILAENVGIDLYNYTSSTGSSVKKAIMAMLQFTLNPQDWPRSQYEDLSDPKVYRLFRNSMRRASGAWTDDKEVQNKVQTYLQQLDSLLGTSSGYSEAAFRKGMDWQLLIQKIGYTF